MNESQVSDHFILTIVCNFRNEKETSMMSEYDIDNTAVKTTYARTQQ